MSSIRAVPTVSEDRTTRARIRDAAIACFAEYGIAETTARRVAAAADVSPGSVIHHFGSMDGLRSACDEHVAAVIRQQKHEALSRGPDLDVLATLRTTNLGPVMRYLAQVLVDDSETVAKLVDELVTDAEGYLEEGVAAGMIEPAANPRGRAVVLTLWNLGALVLHQHLERMLGIDITDPELMSDPRLAAYAGPVYEIYSEGLLTGAFAAQVRSVFGTSPGAKDPTEPVTTSEGPS